MGLDGPAREIIVVPVRQPDPPEYEPLEETPGTEPVEEPVPA